MTGALKHFINNKKVAVTARHSPYFGITFGFECPICHILAGQATSVNIKWS